MRSSDGSPSAGQWSFSAILLAVVWAAEIFAVQEYTLISHFFVNTPPLFLLQLYGVRMALNLAACLLLVCLVPRFWLDLLFVFGLIWSCVLVTYHDYFGYALSFSTIWYHAGEGLSVMDAGWDFLDWKVVGLLTVGLAVKVALRQHFRRHQVGKRWRYGMATAAAAVYLGVALPMIGFVRPVDRLRTWFTPDLVGYMYGYLITWAGEAWYLPQDALLERALRAAQHGSDALRPVEAPLAIGDRLSIVQVESLDFDVLDFRVRGELVTPFLHQLAGRAMFYKIQATHRSGSSDADFVTLTGVMPLGTVSPYKVAGYPYRDCLPQLAHRHGYRCVALHGYWGTFYSRRSAWRKMGFDELHFQKELLAAGYAATGMGVQDADVLDLSARLLAEARQPVIHFVITTTSHPPFDFLPPRHNEPFAQPSSTAQRYLNSMRYVDEVLRRYVAALPPGTTLVLYGDHESRAGYLDRPGGDRSELVPFLIYRKGENLARRQRTHDSGLALSGRLTQLDLVTYLRRQIDGRSGPRRPLAEH